MRSRGIRWLSHMGAMAMLGICVTGSYGSDIAPAAGDRPENGAEASEEIVDEFVVMEDMLKSLSNTIASNMMEVEERCPTTDQHFEMPFRLNSQAILEKHPELVWNQFHLTPLPRDAE